MFALLRRWRAGKAAAPVAAPNAPDIATVPLFKELEDRGLIRFRMKDGEPAIEVTDSGLMWAPDRQPGVVQSKAPTRKAIARAEVERMVAPTRQAELASRWGVTRAAVSQWLQEWEAEGLVKRSADGRGGFLVQSAAVNRLRVVSDVRAST